VILSSDDRSIIAFNEEDKAFLVITDMSHSSFPSIKSYDKLTSIITAPCQREQKSILE
jgi:hypothetical protein